MVDGSNQRRKLRLLAVSLQFRSTITPSRIHAVPDCGDRIAAGQSPNGRRREWGLAMGRLPRVGSYAVRTLLAASLCAAASEPLRAQESASYQMKRIAAVALAEHMSSPSYRTVVTAAEYFGAAGVCPSGTATAFGFWSVLGPLPVPVELYVGKPSPTLGDVELNWSGQATGFQVFRSESPVNVGSPGTLLMNTDRCSATDSSSPGFGLSCYLVIPESDSLQSNVEERHARQPNLRP